MYSSQSGDEDGRVRTTRAQFLKKKNLSAPGILSMEKILVSTINSEVKSNSRLKIFPETAPWNTVTSRRLNMEHTVHKYNINTYVQWSLHFKTTLSARKNMVLN